jgi:hypothetical protein
LINKDNHLLYTDSIENYFSILKSRLQKLDGLTHEELKENITKTIRNIPKEKYRNIIKGAYERPESRRIIYRFSYKMGILVRKGVKQLYRF